MNKVSEFSEFFTCNWPMNVFTPISVEVWFNFMFMVIPKFFCILFEIMYSRTSMARTPMARLPWMSRTHS